jgi:uncharacterized protein YlxW (UPF0749 family)
MKKKNNKYSTVIAISLVLFLLITLLVLQFKTVKESREAKVEDLRDTELQTQIASYKEKYQDAQKQYLDNMNLIGEYNNSIKENNDATNTLQTEYDNSEMALGLTDVRGQGVIITLKDTDISSYQSENLRNLINELKFAGAEAISINDHRIVNLTDIVTLNQSFIVLYGGSVRITSPYVVKAIGNRKYLSSTLNTKNSGFVDLMKSNDLDITVEESDDVRIYKYEKEYETKYIQEVEE